MSETVAVSGSVAASMAQLSFANGARFANIGVDLSSYVGGRYFLELTDSAGKKASGWIESASAGETFSPELVKNNGFDDGVNNWPMYGMGSVTSVAGGQSGNCIRVTQLDGNSTWAFQRIHVPAGSCIKAITLYHKNGSNQGRIIVIDPTTVIGVYSGALYDLIVSDGGWVDRGGFYFVCRTIPDFLIFLGSWAAGGDYTDYDTVSLKQVLTPSSPGVMISWTTEEVGFDRQDGYDYRVLNYDTESGRTGRRGERWKTCQRCGFNYPLSEMTIQDGLEVCTKNCVYEKGRDYYTRLSKVPLEREPEELKGNEESE